MLNGHAEFWFMFSKELVFAFRRANSNAVNHQSETDLVHRISDVVEEVYVAGIPTKAGV